MTNPFELSADVSDPYVRADGKLCIMITICNQDMERELDGTKYTHDGERWKLTDPNG